MKRKKLISLVLLTMMVMAVSVMPGQADEQAALPANLSLEQAVELAVANSPSAALAKNDLDETSLSYIKARHAARKLDDSSGGSYSENLTEYLTPKIAQRQEETKKKVYDGTINGIKISAESAFYELLKARENVRIAENALQRADEQVKIAQTKVQIGSGSNVDLIGVQASQAAARATLVSAQNTAKLKLMDLNKTMGVDLEAQYNLTGSFEFKKEEFKLQDLLDKALSEEVGLIAAQDACDIATWTYEFQKLFYSSRSYDVKSSEHDKIAAELTLKQTHDNLITSVTENYYSYLALEEKYQYLQKALELQKETYRLKKLSYEVGMATSEDVMQASDNVEVAEYNLTDCIFSYNLLKSSFKYNTYN